MHDMMDRGVGVEGVGLGKRATNPLTCLEHAMDPHFSSRLLINCSRLSPLMVTCPIIQFEFNDTSLNFKGAEKEGETKITLHAELISCALSGRYIFCN